MQLWVPARSVRRSPRTCPPPATRFWSADAHHDRRSNCGPMSAIRSWSRARSAPIRPRSPARSGWFYWRSKPPRTPTELAGWPACVTRTPSSWYCRTGWSRSSRYSRSARRRRSSPVSSGFRPRRRPTVGCDCAERPASRCRPGLPRRRSPKCGAPPEAPPTATPTSSRPRGASCWSTPSPA